MDLKVAHIVGDIPAMVAMLENDDFNLADPRVLCSALADANGIPLVGRNVEARYLEAAGYRSLPFGRLYEGHTNVLQLIGRLGTPQQKNTVYEQVEHGKIYGLWNTEGSDGVQVFAETENGIVLKGKKTFCSGAPHIHTACISARRPDGGMQLMLIDMQRERPSQDASFWQPLGMEASESFAVDFSGTRVLQTEILGKPDAYTQSPWFEAGAWRFLAVQTGGLRRLLQSYIAWLQASGRDIDQLVTANVGYCTAAYRTCTAWLLECSRAWQDFDAKVLEATELMLTVDTARVAVERAALEIAERIERGVGAKGLLEPAPFSRGLRDLRMYLRQPAPDQAILRIGTAALGKTMRA